MITLLKIAVVAVLVVGLVLIGGGLLFVRWLRKVLKTASDAPTCPPCRVYPEPEPNPQWRTPDKMRRYATEFRAVGFEEVGAFTIPQMDGLQMLAFVHPSERLYGVIYDQKLVPTSFDLFCNFEDQTSLSASSSKAGCNLDKRPGHPILWTGEERVAAVLEALRQQPQTAARVPVSAAEFLATFKRNYAEGMNWRMKKGGVSRDEIRRQAESRGNKLDEEAMDEAYKRLRKAHIVEPQRGCLAQYLDQEQILAAHWERELPRTLVIPETLDTGEVVEALEVALALNQEQRHTLRQLRGNKTQSALDSMDEILGQDVGALGLEKLGEVSEPVRAYVFMIPACEQPAKALTAYG
jgi:hypothetical protein